MVKINLLPWRDAERQRRQREFITIVALAIGLVLAGGYLVKTQYDQAIAHQNSRNNLLSQKIRELDRVIAEIRKLEDMKADLEARIKIIQNLQESRPEIVHLFDQIVNTVPEGVFINRIDHSGRNVQVFGRAQSNARVSAFMRNIEDADWVTNPSLVLIENREQTGTGLSHFQLRFSQHRQRAN